MTDAIRKLAEEWLSLDQDPVTKNEISKLLSRNETETLSSLLQPGMTFGTAGLRAPMGPGYARMNSLTVIQATQGFVDYLQSQIGDAKERGIAIGHDARHNSETFARLAAGVALTGGMRVYWLGMCHTPLVPFCVARKKAAGGVMITASHNPKADNGYKVYWENACQIIPPLDRGIADCITQSQVPQSWEKDAIDRTEFAHITCKVKKEIEQEYIEAVTKATGWSTGDSSSIIPHFTYTPMHGVGRDIFIRVLSSVGLQEKAHVVESQAEPDPEFPTVKFPNPEEKGALDEAIKIATLHHDTIVLANDPDADRFSVAIFHDGRWIQLTGNQIGILLASAILDGIIYPTQQDASTETRQIAVLASAVSSRMLSHVARQRSDVHFEETLTGFKWLGNRAQELDKEDYKTAFAFEEALGYMLPEVAYDKDGISAALLFLKAVLHWQKQGLTPWTKLQDLYKTYGYFAEANTYLISPSPSTTKAIFDEIRAQRPDKVGQQVITRWRDMTTGYDTSTADNKPLLPIDSGAQMITCELNDNVVFTIRGSGTEPKIKLYIEAKAESMAEAEKNAKHVQAELIESWFQPEKNGLRLPS